MTNKSIIPGCIRSYAIPAGIQLYVIPARSKRDPRVFFEALWIPAKNTRE